MTLKELLKDWTDYDIAEYYLACCLGIMKYDAEFKPQSEYSIAKSVFWTGNPLGDSLYAILEKLVEVGVLEKDDDSLFKWNEEYKGYWEDRRV